MATKREIEIAKLSFFEGFSAGIGEKKNCRMSKEQYAAIAGSIPHNIEEERKEFECAYADLFGELPVWDSEFELYSTMEQDEGWRLWKAARGIE